MSKISQKYKSEYYQQFSKFQQNREKYFYPKVKKVLDAQIRDFVYYLIFSKSFERSYSQLNFNVYLELIQQINTDAFTNYSKKVRRSILLQKKQLEKKEPLIPIGYSERMIRLMNEYYGVDFLNFAEQINESTKLFIRTILQKANKDGLSFDEIVTLLSNKELNAIRARRIARTETVAAANAAAITAAKDTGIVKKKEWLATMDSRTRHTHRNVDGQVVDIDAYFNVGQGTEMKVPGDRGGKEGKPFTPVKEIVNCRCTTLFVVDL